MTQAIEPARFSLSRLARAWRRLRRDNSAVAMIETAITFPTLVLGGFAGLEIANLMVTHTRVSGIALTVADNASRIAANATALSLPQVREVDVNDVFRGAQLQSGNLDLQTNGRVILSSLETNATGGQWIHWQRCFGSLNYQSSYGTQGNGAVGNAFPGMGPAGEQVQAVPGTPVMFAEVFYDYEPFMLESFIGTRTIHYTAAFSARDSRDTSQIFNPAPAAVARTCPAGRSYTRTGPPPWAPAWGYWN